MSHDSDSRLRAKSIGDSAKTFDLPRELPLVMAIRSPKSPRRRASDPLSAYLDQLSRVPPADEDELQEQGERLGRTRERLQEAIGPAEVARCAAEYKVARQELVRSHLRLVLFLARPYASRTVSLIDLVQEGNLGLMQAADLFDPARGCRFSTYAGWWIRNCILNALACHGGPVKIPVSTLIHLTRLRRASNSLGHRYGRPATVEEIAEASQVTMLEASRAIRHSQPVVSLNASFVRGSDGSIADRTPDPFVGETVWSDTQEKRVERIREAIESLSERERRILEMRFGLSAAKPRSRRETAEAMNVSPERIRQLEIAALRRLRDPNRWRVPLESLF
jgi:RNA polymerase primary sigma factor